MKIGTIGLAVAGVTMTVLLRLTAHSTFIWIFDIKLGMLHPFAWEAMTVALVIVFVSFVVKPDYKLGVAVVAAGLSVCTVLLAIADSACATGTLMFSAIAGFMVQRALRLADQKAIADLILVISWMVLLLGTAVAIFSW